MKELYILMILATTQMSFAQTTLTDAANKPVVGNSFSGNTVIGTVDNSATGAATTFSNPTLTAGAAATTSYVVPTAAEITTFPGSNLKQDDGSGNLLIFKSTTNKLEITGLTNSTATLNFSGDNATYLAFPVAFGYINNDNAKGTFSSAAASGIFKGTIKGTGDASGTLVIGTKTYTNVLRVKVVQNYNLHDASDTFYIFPIGTITTTTYFYYDNIRKFPLLTDTTGTVVVSLAGINQTENFALAQDIVFLKTGEAAEKSTFTVYPNPVDDVLRFKGLSKKGQSVKIYSVDGKLVSEKKLSSDEMNVSNLTSGNYFITVSGEGTDGNAVKVIKK